MRSAQERVRAYLEKYPDHPEKLAWNLSLGWGLKIDPAADDPHPDALVPRDGAWINDGEERVRLASMFRLDPGDPITDCLFDALDLAWAYPSPLWFQEVRRCCIREGFGLPRDDVVAVVTRTWACRSLAETWTEAPDEPRGRAAVLALATLVLTLPTLRSGFRDVLREAATQWGAAREFLLDVRDRGVVRDPIGQFRDLLIECQSVPAQVQPEVIGSTRAVEPVDHGHRRVLAREGEAWLFEFEGERAYVTSNKGARVLATLLSRPGERVDCLELDGRQPVEGELPAAEPGELERLETEAAAAEGHGRGAEACEIREHIAALRDRSGAPRRESSSRQKARKAVGKAIRTVLTSLRRPCPKLHGHLRSAIQDPNGLSPAYMPPPDSAPWLIRSSV